MFFLTWPKRESTENSSKNTPAKKWHKFFEHFSLQILIDRFQRITGPNCAPKRTVRETPIPCCTDGISGNALRNVPPKMVRSWEIGTIFVRNPSFIGHKTPVKYKVWFKGAQNGLNAFKWLVQNTKKAGHYPKISFITCLKSFVTFYDVIKTKLTSYFRYDDAITWPESLKFSYFRCKKCVKFDTKNIFWNF